MLYSAVAQQDKGFPAALQAEGKHEMGWNDLTSCKFGIAAG